MALVAQLYPKGRAFKMVVAGYKESMHRAISSQKAILYADMVSTFDSVIPDNPYFNLDDATAWEKRLGLITIASVPLDERKKGIIRKMNYPGEYAARGHYLFLQNQLQKAGFNVFIYENRFDNGSGGYFTKDPLSIGGEGVVNQHGDFQHGDAQHGSYFGKLVVNYLEPELDASFDIGYHLRSTFFIGGEALDPDNYMGEVADVPANRESEFRQLILRLKPTQTVGLLFVNYV